MELENKIVVLAGATGEVGEGIARVMIDQGVILIVPYRSEKKLEELKSRLPAANEQNLIAFQANVSEPREAEVLRNMILTKFGRVDLAIASLGGWYQGYELHNMPTHLWYTIMDNNLNSHFIFARTFISVLNSQNDGLYININGGAQDFVAPQAGGMTIISSAQNKMTEVFATEARGKKYRVHSVAAYTPVVTHNRTNPKPEWLTAEDIGHFIVKLYRDPGSKGEITHKLYKKDQI
jgi:NADP-dependent 3-hydroxy acid dehydrogenase YdfG